MTLPFALLTATGLLLAWFALAYALARRLDNYSIVDVVWAYTFTGVAWFYAFTGDGWSMRQLVIASLASAWSVRLGTHLYRRVAGHHPSEDSRYRQLRTDWKRNFGTRMFGFYQFQALTVAILALPLLFAVYNPTPFFNAWEMAGTALCFLALCGEVLADNQLAAFRRQPENRGEVCQVGLWRYSRHPNYFFEWVIWVGFGLFALGSAHGWIGLIAPISMYGLLRYRTGVPMAEASSLQSKGDRFRAYQQTTNEFFPGPTRAPDHD